MPSGAKKSIVQRRTLMCSVPVGQAGFRRTAHVVWVVVVGMIGSRRESNVAEGNRTGRDRSQVTFGHFHKLPTRPTDIFVMRHSSRWSGLQQVLDATFLCLQPSSNGPGRGSRRSGSGTQGRRRPGHSKSYAITGLFFLPFDPLHAESGGTKMRQERSAVLVGRSVPVHGRTEGRPPSVLPANRCRVSARRMRGIGITHSSGGSTAREAARQSGTATATCCCARAGPNGRPRNENVTIQRGVECVRGMWRDSSGSNVHV